MNLPNIQYYMKALSLKTVQITTTVVGYKNMV